ncbi:MAG TPA: adenylate/guanylate cyclase domain-containing protein [Reyranella sp.]|nr:adenylate/guanylate cyclase domain-containing protein [Reyranella sp.]
MTDKVKRRLTTVLCADVSGYSRLMEADETGTLETLRRARTAMAGLVERHDGRIVNTWGDAIISEFASVVEAVQCAVEIQQEISNREAEPLPEQRMRFRIGINLGDVMVDGSDIYGDGVNIASRLQELAEPGGIVVSSSVYDQVYNKLPVGFDCLGQQQMKNVAPVVSYRVAMAGGGDGRQAGARPADVRQPEAMATPQPDAPPHHEPPRSRTALQSAAYWFAHLPRPAAAMITIAGFLILTNLFTNPHRIWFHWPVAALLFVVVMRTVFRRRDDR